MLYAPVENKLYESRGICMIYNTLMIQIAIKSEWVSVA